MIRFSPEIYRASYLAVDDCQINSNAAFLRKIHDGVLIIHSIGFICSSHPSTTYGTYRSPPQCSRNLLGTSPLTMVRAFAN